jgi:FMN reductase
VIGSPTFKGSCTGLFKHFFDLLEPTSLKGSQSSSRRGGGERHSLVVEHQLRPLFGYFEALTIPTGIYASDRDFPDGVIISEGIRDRTEQAVTEGLQRTGSLKLRGAVNRIAQLDDSERHRAPVAGDSQADHLRHRR